MVKNFIFVIPAEWSLFRFNEVFPFKKKQLITSSNIIIKIYSIIAVVLNFREIRATDHAVLVLSKKLRNLRNVSV